jgi:serine/threonine protein kinase
VIDDSAEEFRPLEQQLREDFFNISMPNTLELNLEDFELLLSYLRRMLVIDPEKRASLNELITEPWIFEAP